jgi:ADP-heptose:LPS heptosyltransferase
VYGDRKKIGIIWAGSPDQENDHHRSASVGDFLGLYAAEGVQLYSFQVGDRAKECRSVAPLVIDLAPKIRDFTDTAALMLQMDAIVTVCTSTAHLAGVLGVPVHIVLPRHGQHFVWGHSGSTTPWYPSARLHRQERIGDWGPVIRGVAEALRTSSTASRSMILKPSFIRWELGI